MMTNAEYAVIRFAVGENLDRTVATLPGEEGIEEYLHHKKPLLDIS